MNVEEVNRIKDACIYRITFPNGMKYVGQTKNLSNRFKLYTKCCSGSFGNSSEVVDRINEVGIANINIDILTKIAIEDSADLLLCLSILEIKYIRSENSLSPNGYNNSIGGEILGIPLDYLSMEYNIDFGSKPILVYDSNGQFLNEYNSIRGCAYGLGVDPKTIRPMIDRRDTLFVGEYMLRSKKYNEVPKEIVPFKPKRVQKTIYNIKKIEKVIHKDKNVYNNYQVLKYTKDGVYCGLYKTSADAALSIGRSSIRKGVIINGYIFFYYDGGEIKQNIGDVTVNGHTAISRKYSEALIVPEDSNVGGFNKYAINNNDVVMYDSEGNYYNKFKSAADAASFLGLTSMPKGIIRRGYIIFDSDDQEIKQKIEMIVNRRTIEMNNSIPLESFSDGENLPCTQIDFLKKYKYQVAKYDLDGVYIKTYDSLNEAASDNGLYESGIRANLNGTTKRAGNFLWRKVINGKVCKIGKDQNNYSSKDRKYKHSFKVGQYSLDGKYVCTYDNIADASTKTGLPYSCISACVLGKTKHSKGFIWKKVE